MATTNRFIVAMKEYFSRINRLKRRKAFLRFVRRFFCCCYEESVYLSQSGRFIAPPHLFEDEFTEQQLLDSPVTPTGDLWLLPNFMTLRDYVFIQDPDIDGEVDSGYHALSSSFTTASSDQMTDWGMEDPNDFDPISFATTNIPSSLSESPDWSMPVGRRAPLFTFSTSPITGEDGLMFHEWYPQGRLFKPKPHPFTAQAGPITPPNKVVNKDPLVPIQQRTVVSTAWTKPLRHRAPSCSGRCIEGCRKCYRRSVSEKEPPSPCASIRRKKQIPREKEIRVKRDLKFNPILPAIPESDMELGPQMNPFSVPLNFSLDNELTDILTSLSESLRNGINIQHGLDPEVRSSLDRLSHVLHDQGGISTSVNISAFGEDTQKILLLCALVGTTLYHLQHRDKSSLGFMLAILAVTLARFGMFNSIFAELGANLSAYLTRFDQTSSQMTTGDLDKVVTAVMTAFVTLTVGKADRSLIGELMSHATSFKKNKESLISCFTSAMQLLETVVSFVSRDILGGSTYSFLQSNRSDVNEFIARVNKLSDDIHHQRFAYTQSNATFIHELWLESKALILKIPRGEDNGVILALNNASQYLLSQKKIFDGMNLTLNGSRVEPVSALFLGPPGTGKSNLLYPLSYKLLLRTLPKEKIAQFKSDPNSFIYNRQPETVYWDGYNMDKVICFIDDLGQLRDVAGNPDNEWMNWIRMCSSFNYVLHMAALEKKGNVHFQSRFVFANSNLRTFNIESIVEIEAFERRVDHCYICVPKVEYCKPGTDKGNLWGRRLDGRKLPIGPLGITELTPDTSEFFEWDIDAGAETGRILSYAEVADEIYQTSLLKSARFDQTQMYLNRVIAEEEMQTQAGRVSPPSRYAHLFEEDSFDKILINLLGAHNYIFGTHAPFETMMEFWEAFNPDMLDVLLKGGQDGIREFQRYVVGVDIENPYQFLPRPDPPTPLDRMKDVFTIAYERISEILEKANNWLISTMTYVRRWYATYWNTWVGAFAIIATSTILHYIGTMFYTRTIQFFTQSYSGKPQKDRSDKSKRKSLSSKDFKAKAESMRAPPPSTQSSGSYDPSNEAIVTKIIRRNCYELWLPDQECRLGFVTFVKGRVFLMPKHFAGEIYSAIEDYPQYTNSLVTFKKSGSTIEVQCRMIDMLNVVSSTELDSLDCVLIKAPDYFDIHADITKYFLTRDEVSKLKMFDFRLVLPMTHGFECWMGKAHTVTNEIVNGEDSYVLAKGYRYMAMTSEGDCGALMTIVSHYTAGKKVLGIHVAGSPAVGTGLSTCVTYEDITREVPEGEIVMDFESDVYPQAQTIILDGRFKELYHHQLTVNSPCFTKIRRSPLHHLWGPAKTAPAKLRPFYNENEELVNPYLNALSKYCLPFTYVNPMIVGDVGDNVFENLIKKSSINVDKRLLTWEECILGIEGEPDFKAVSRSTSLGFPDNSIPGKKPKGKTGLYGTGEIYTIDSPKSLELLGDCKIIENRALQGVRLEHIFIDQNKDERRPWEKVKLGKTRLFSCCPYRLLLLFRRYFGSFLLWTVKNRIRNGFAVGVNPYSSEWQLIADEMNHFGGSAARNKGAGDFSSYDGGLKPVFLWDMFYRINDWYDDEYTTIRRVLWCEIVSSKHIFGNLVYQWVSSNPSGEPLTTLVNNLYNHYVANYVWYRVHEFDILELAKFYTYVYYITFGDDNMFSVCQSRIHVFNEKAMEMHCPEIGMSYTSETKGAAQEMRLITEVSFLKRKFRYEKLYDRYCAPLELEVILEIPYWIQEGENRHERIHDNVNLAIRELALHDEDTFNEWVPKIVKAYKEKCNESPDCARRNILLRAIDKRSDWY